MKVSELEKLCKLVLDEKTATAFYGRFTAEPLERGYGQTIGNSLRRILLSSLEGAAIISTKITGALHEFAVLKGIKEDVVQIVLNLKKIRVKLHSDGPEKLYLKVKNSGKITAKDIDININVKILNPEQEIANLDNGATLEMEMEVSKGKGYVIAEEMKSNKHPVGTIFLDSLFSPVTKVNYEVENTRVEQDLNYDKLILEIWTDGSIYPKDALMNSAKILRNSLLIFTEDPTGIKDIFTENFDANISNQEEENDIFKQSINVMNISTRVSNSLKNAGIETIGQLVKKKEEEVMNFTNFGQRSFKEIKEKLAKLNLMFGMDTSGGAKK